MKTLIQSMADVDVRVFLKIYGLNGRRYLDHLMTALSVLGNGYLYPVLLALCAVVDWQTAQVLLPVFGLAIVVELAVTQSLKRAFRRERPCEILRGIAFSVSPQDRFSFPSGHTASAFLTATLISFYPLLTVPAFLYASLMGFSRVYNGVHYASDVIAGMILGTASALTGLWILA